MSTALSSSAVLSGGLDQPTGDDKMAATAVYITVIIHAVDPGTAWSATDDWLPLLFL